MNTITINLTEDGILKVSSELGEGFEQDLKSDSHIYGAKILNCLVVKDKIESFLFKYDSKFVFDSKIHSTNLTVFYDQIISFFEELKSFLDKETANIVEVNVLENNTINGEENSIVPNQE